MWTSVKWGMMVTVFSVSLTCTHVVTVLMVLIVETGISLMELDCHSLLMVISIRVVVLRELIYVVTLTLTHGIYRRGIPTTAVHDDRDRDTVYVGLYTASGGNANWKSHNKQDCHSLTSIYGPQI